jgi:hypothetical protein
VRWAHACVLFRASKKFPGEFWQYEKERIWARKNSQGFERKNRTAKGKKSSREERKNELLG